MLFLQPVRCHVKAKIIEHLSVAFNGGTAGGEHVAGDAGAGSAGKAGFSVLCHQCPSSGQTNVGGRVDKAEDGNRTKNILLGKTWKVAERGSLDGHQGIDWDGVHLKLGQSQSHIQSILPGLTHTNDTAGADGKALGFGSLYVSKFVGKAVGGTDAGEKPLRCLNVAVDAIDACLMKAM